MKQCPITKKKVRVAGGYSNATRATQFNPTGKRTQSPNLQRKAIFIPETGKTMKLRLSARAIKTINKNGAFKTLKKAGLIK
jgi:large subunit ribosomal protein L28